MNHNEHYARQRAVELAIRIAGEGGWGVVTIIGAAQSILDFIGIPKDPDLNDEGDEDDLPDPSTLVS